MPLALLEPTILSELSNMCEVKHLSPVPSMHCTSPFIDHFGSESDITRLPKYQVFQGSLQRFSQYTLFAPGLLSAGFHL